MTEDEWLMCTDPKSMLESVGQGNHNPRKWRLFACACCRAVWDDMWPHRSRAVVVAAEQFADGLITEKELNNSRSLACQTAQNAVVFGSRRQSGHSGRVLEGRLTFAADAALANHHIAYRMGIGYPVNLNREDDKMQEIIPTILRDIFGNPFRPVAVDPSWLTSDVRTLAVGIYQDRAFDRLPILADALMDAGCDNEDVLTHCRGLGPHVRGCWVIDLLLGKE